MEVMKEVLDKQVVDRDGREMGRVDGILLEYQTGQPPRLKALLIGPAALGYRLHPLVGGFIRALEKRFGLDRDRPAQIDFAEIKDFEHKVRLRIRIGETAVEAVEQRLRALLLRLPGSR